MSMGGMFTELGFGRNMTAYNTSVDIALDGNLYILLAAGQISAGEIQRHSSRYVIGPYDFTCGEW